LRASNDRCSSACKRKEQQQQQGVQTPGPKKPRLVFTDIQRRTLQVRRLIIVVGVDNRRLSFIGYLARMLPPP
uniref:Ovule protein n=1 Tax=Soboliphyme baturini TaxID=241478 RepID=A0A183J3G5_9BILA